MLSWFNRTMNEEKIRNRIRELLDKIQSEADPVLLNRCRSIFRQEVSFFHRSYMAAYLLLLAEGFIEEKPANDSFRSGNYSKKRKDLFREKRSKSSQTESNTDDFRADSPRVLNEEESVQLFISIGRNRKVFPREILALIIAKAKLTRDDIGMIRILDNYSFVQIRNSVADTVIKVLNGQKFRGRTLTVNFARTRREGEEVPGDDPSDASSETESND